MHVLTTTALVAALTAFSAAPVLAQSMGEGRQGPRVFSDHVLDQSLTALNGFLQDRYQFDDAMARLAGTDAPEADFKTVALAVVDVPEFRPIQTDARFGDGIGGGKGLDAYLASFNEDLHHREDPLFVRIARAAGGTGLDFSEVAAIPPETADAAAFGPEVFDDLTLDAHMLSLFDHMLAHQERDTTLRGVDPAAVNGSSFDRYGEALKLF